MRTAACLLLLAIAAGFVSADCNSNYDQCITSCCSQCGSTLDQNSAGDLVCDVGTQANPNQACIQACTPCSTSYQSCVASQGASPGVSGSTSASCCGSAAILLLVSGFVFSRK